MSELKTALITGASEGIGRCFAETFASHGHDLILVARNEEKLKSLAAELEMEHAIRVHCIAMDLIPDGAAQQLYERVEADGLQVDILVNNAGMMLVERFDTLAVERSDQLIHLNLNALVNLSHRFLQPMIARGNGRLVNIGSVASFMPTPGFTVYGATKAFVLSFTEGLSVELKGTGVSATCVCPGFTDTKMLEEANGMEKYIPSFMKADPASLAEESYKAVMQGKTIYVDKLNNRILVQWAKHNPRWLVRGVSGMMSKLK